VRDLTNTDLRNAILALAAADVAVSNDSGLLHVAAAIGTPTIGIFGPTSPWHWAPLNPIAAAVQTATQLDCQPCHKPTCRVRHHRCMRDISTDQVLEVTRRTLAQAGAA
jgi:heptosyltransferase-2